MSILNRLSSAFGRRDDVLNRRLAGELAATEATEDIRELVANLRNSERTIQSDCIKVLYEIADVSPRLIAPYTEVFLSLLNSGSNRLVWGAMCALASVSEISADLLFEHRKKIEDAIDKGTVITVDRGIKVLATVAGQRVGFQQDIFPYLLQHLKTCRSKDVPRDAEAILKAVSEANAKEFTKVVESRMGDMSSSQMKRLGKVIKTAGKL